MSDPAEKIRLAIMASLYLTGGTTIAGTPYSHDDYDAAHWALDDLLGELEATRADVRRYKEWLVDAWAERDAAVARIGAE